MEIILNNLLFLTLGSLLILSAIMVTLSSNPVHSILFLVLVFILTTILFLLANVEFISMLFLVVYLGAIIVLFLFVVMMLNIRIIELKDRLFSYLPISMIIISLCFVPIVSIIITDFINPTGDLLSVNMWQSINQFSFANIYPTTNLQLIAMSLYKYYNYPFLLAGVVLFVAMIGAIVLTLTKLHKNKRQDFYYQTTKDIFLAIKKLK